MSARASREARLLRGSLIAGWGALLAVGGHLAGGGSLPASPGLLLLIVLAAAACTLLSDREWSGPRLLAALAAVELVVHWALSGVAGHGSHAGHGTASSSGWLMLSAHVLAALLSAWGLRHGEATYWRLVEHLARRPLPRVVVAALVAPPRIRTGFASELPLALTCLTNEVSRRGPPQPVA